jgi:diphthine-ammonia ligase
VDTVFHSDNDLAPVAFLRIKTATLCSKSNVPPPDTRIPPILAPDSLGVRDSVIRSQRSIKYLRDDLHHQLDEPCSDHISSKKLGTWIAIANVQRPPDAEGISVEAETHACFHALKGM